MERSSNQAEGSRPSDQFYFNNYGHLLNSAAHQSNVANPYEAAKRRYHQYQSI